MSGKTLLINRDSTIDFVATEVKRQLMSKLTEQDDCLGVILIKLMETVQNS